jgi:hypothetical protein
MIARSQQTEPRHVMSHFHVIEAALVDDELRHVHQERFDGSTLQAHHGLADLQIAKYVLFIVLQQHGLAHRAHIRPVLQVEAEGAIRVPQGRHGNLARMLVQDDHRFAELTDLTKTSVP